MAKYSNVYKIANSVGPLIQTAAAVFFLSLFSSLPVVLLSVTNDFKSHLGRNVNILTIDP